MRALTFALVVTTALLGACSKPPASKGVGSLLSTTQIREILVGNTLVSAASEANFFAVYYMEDGSERGIYIEDRDTGRWRVYDNALCSRWDNWGDQEQCFTLYQNADGEITAYLGAEKSFLAFIEEGNSHNL